DAALWRRGWVVARSGQARPRKQVKYLLRLATYVGHTPGDLTFSVISANRRSRFWLRIRMPRASDVSSIDFNSPSRVAGGRKQVDGRGQYEPVTALFPTWLRAI